MNGAEFTADVLTFLDVDGNRRGIAAFRTAYIKAAVADLASYIDEYNTGQVTYADDEQTPFDSETAEAVAEFLKSKITRNIDRDLQLSQAHMAAYMNLRRRIWVRLREARAPELRPWWGKKFITTLVLRGLNRIPLTLLANVWFTVKHSRAECDDNAVFQLVRGDGIEVLDLGVGGRIRVTISEEQAKLLTQPEYYWDVLVEDTDHNPIYPISGMLRPRIPVTRDYAPSVMAIDDDAPDDVPLSFI